MTPSNLSTEITYRIQNQDQHSDRWFNDALSVDRALADQSLAQARERYPNIKWRLLQITATTIVIA